MISVYYLPLSIILFEEKLSVHSNIIHEVLDRVASLEWRLLNISNMKAIYWRPLVPRRCMHYGHSIDSGTILMLFIRHFYDVGQRSEDDIADACRLPYFIWISCTE